MVWPGRVHFLPLVALTLSGHARVGLSSPNDSGNIGSDTCNRAARTGTWVEKQCTEPAVTYNLDMTAKERWDALDCDSGWQDIINSWQGCAYGKNNEATFSEHVASYLYITQNPECNDLGQATTCTYVQCAVHNTPQTEPELRTGACAYELWNGLVEIRRILRNYVYSLESTGNSLQFRRKTLIKTFAPTPNDNPNIFDDLLDRIIDAWKEPVSQLLTRIFDGEPENVKLLTDLVSDGKMIGGMMTEDENEDEDHPDYGYRSDYTKNMQIGMSIERAFYALAIPALWGADRRTPFILDFGPDCVIDATRYFEERADEYNAGWRCHDGHSYILAGVDDEPERCTSPNPNRCVLPLRRNFFKILRGIGEIQEPKERWGRVTVDDLITGAVNTYRMNKNKNVMRTAKSMTDHTDVKRFETLANQDIRLGGFQHIPICGAEEARANLLLGRKRYGDSPNYPCNP